MSKPCSNHDWAKMCKEKSTLFPNNDQSFSGFWVFFWREGIGIFGPKTAKFGQKFAFLVILGQKMAFLVIFGPNICLFEPLWCSARPKNNGNKVSSWFSDMCVSKLLALSQKLGYWPKYVGTRTFTPSQNNYDVWPKNSHFCPKICFLGQL